MEIRKYQDEFFLRLPNQAEYIYFGKKRSDAFFRFCKVIGQCVPKQYITRPLLAAMAELLLDAIESNEPRTTNRETPSL